MKGLAIDYYRKVARWMLPHLRGVPVAFKRYPGPIDGLSFWEKDAPSFTPEWVRTVAVPRRSDGSEINYIVVDDVKTLAWIATVGGIEIHPFLHRAPKLNEATAVVFDLDPGEDVAFAQICDVALILRHTLAALKLESFAKVSGSKGVQVYVPLNSGATHGATQAFAKVVAEELAKAHPSSIVADMSKALRRRKVFIDWSQNADYKTTVAVYSLRATGRVSMPVTWEEIERGEAMAFTTKEALARVRKKGDLFAPVLKLTQALRFSVEDRRPRLSPRTGQARVPVLHRKGRTQSGRRRFTKTKTELRLEVGGTFNVRNRIEDSGTYEIVEYDERRYLLWFSGETMRGPWLLEKANRRWSLAPAPTA
jgi:bifunctional non-homologous end joining protein LigD